MSNCRGSLSNFAARAHIIDEVIFHQPNGTFIARRVEE